MDRHMPDAPISALLEVMPMYHSLILNKLELNKTDSSVQHITKSQFHILLALMADDSLTMTQLSACIASSKEQTTRAVAPLVTAGLAERIHDETNRKLVRIRLTANGRLFLHHTKEHLQHSLEQKFRSLSQTDQEELVQSLYTLLRILKKMQE